jgi:hypothetical protein
MDGKIKDVQSKNALLEEEFPSRNKQTAAISESAPEQPIENGETTLQENKENILNIEDKKQKSLTKKQLEKKFKDDILRVREKMDKKK